MEGSEVLVVAGLVTAILATPAAVAVVRLLMRFTERRLAWQDRWDHYCVWRSE